MNEFLNRCQCMSSCKKPSLPGKAFCKDHMDFCPRVSPLSGWEPDYEPDRWNAKKEIRTTHNCFSYSFNIMDTRQIKSCLNDSKCDVPFHQPGSMSGWPRFNDTDPKTCPNMIARLMGDNPTLIPTEFESRCPSGTSKIVLIVDEDQDYHFLRQDSNGFWSQKGGAQPVTNLDAQGHTIYDPLLANHNNNRIRADPLNYDVFCGYFCVPRDRPLFVKVGGRRYKYSITRNRRHKH